MNPSERYLVFKVAGELYAIPLIQLREVIAEPEITSVPFAPHYVLGIVNLRGKIISIIDLQTRFGLNRVDSTEQTQSVLIVDLDGSLLGIRVESVELVATFGAGQLEATPTLTDAIWGRFAESIARHDRQLIVVLSSEKLFSFEETSEADVGTRSTAAA